MTGDALNFSALPPPFARSLRPAIGIALLGLATMAIALAFDPAHVWRAYLMAWLDCLAVAIGSMVIVMMHHLTGGRWGWPVRRIGEAAAMTLPWITVAFLPLLFGLRSIFPWADPALVATHAPLAHRAPVFSVTAVVGRSLVFLALWSFFAWRLSRNSARHDRDGSDDVLARLRRLSAFGLVVSFVTVSLASIDWIASREIDWYSSTFGLITVLGQAASGFAFCIVCISSLHRRPEMEGLISPRAIHDLGNLLQTSVVVWAYVSFMQYLVIWIGDEQDDIVWFHHRTVGGWMFVGVALMLLHFALPFVLLLFQNAKRNPSTLGLVAAGVLFMRCVDTLWSVAPSSLDISPLPMSWLDPVAVIALGAAWWVCFATQLRQRPLRSRAAIAALEAYA